MERAGVEEGLVCRLKCSFDIYQRSMWPISVVGQPKGMMLVGSDCAVLCRILLIVF